MHTEEHCEAYRHILPILCCKCAKKKLKKHISTIAAALQVDGIHAEENNNYEV
jgi:hypothetical protein